MYISNKFNNYNVKLSRHWLIHIIIFLMLLLVICAGYKETFRNMLSSVISNDSFTHIYLVPFIFLWLLFRRSNQVKSLNLYIDLRGLIIIFVIGFIWIISKLMFFQYIEQLSLIGLIIAAAWCVFGFSVIKCYLFPLFFLLFLVPPVSIHNKLVPIMMEVTADIAEFLLEKTGIPVFREETTLHLPTGSWYVAPACSGTQYLISSLVIGCVFSYIAYRSLYKKVIFLIFSVMIPIIGNGFRVYGTIMIGHINGTTLALSFDHVFYGLIFFSVLISVMLFGGALWWEKEEDYCKETAMDSKKGDSKSAMAIKLIRNQSIVLMLAIFIMLFWPLVLNNIEEKKFSSYGQIKLPIVIGKWHADFGKRWPWYPVIESSVTEILRVYNYKNKSIAVFVSQIKSFSDLSDIELVHSSKNIEGQLGTNKIKISYRNNVLEINEKKIPVVNARTGSIDSMLIWYWFLIDGLNTVDRNKIKFKEIISAIEGKAYPVYLISLSTIIPHSIEESRSLLKYFVLDLLNNIEINSNQYLFDAVSLK